MPIIEGGRAAVPAPGHRRVRGIPSACYRAIVSARLWHRKSPP
ncbi:hypothetical protein CU044_5847 [Streptomyces sp. L-9-10]|nr:hypothetical protein CU044_5847 [Streptomyces sp. L-9-10]